MQDFDVTVLYRKGLLLVLLWCLPSAVKVPKLSLSLISLSLPLLPTLPPTITVHCTNNAYHYIHFLFSFLGLGVFIW